jgi:AraC-like DNA-binding protein/ligand-binding sensor protein
MQTIMVERNDDNTPASRSLGENARQNPKASMASAAANDEHSLLEAMIQSEIYREYERAFNETTGLPLTLRATDSWQLPHHNRRKENPFCALMAQRSKSCAACLQTHQRLSEAAINGVRSVTCTAGLCDMAVPVRLGNRVVGLLQTGQVHRKKPTNAQFDRTAKLVAEWGHTVDVDTLRAAYFNTRVLSSREHEAVLTLLTIFAQQLSVMTNQLVLQRENAEPPVIRRAKEYIAQHQSEDLSLGQVARSVNTSTYYFCKLFKRYTGMHFTDYVSRVRIEKAKNLLLNPNLRISEIAYEVGFQSLTHFNRVFKKVLGLSPTEYRAKLPRA